MKISIAPWNVSTKKGFSIKIQIYKDAKNRKYIPTGFYTLKKDWDELKEEPRKSHPQYFDLMDYLYSKRLILTQTTLRVLRDNLSIDAIEKLIIGNQTNIDSFTDFWEELSTEYARRGMGKALHYKNCLSAFRLFKKNVQFSEINYSLLLQFKEFKTNAGCAGGINSYLACIKAVRNEAIKREVYMPTSPKNPFQGIMERKVETKSKDFSDEEMKKILTAIPPKKMNSQEDSDYYNYFWLCFYLGGIDLIDLANLRYDKHVKDGRVTFIRFKGGTNERIDNIVLPEAIKILEKYDCQPYLVNIHKYKYISHRSNYCKRFGKYLKSIGVTSYFGTKTPRYTFINIGSKKLLLNREVIKEIVGHASKDVLGIYENSFDNRIRDEIHSKIIQAVSIEG